MSHPLAGSARIGLPCGRTLPGLAAAGGIAAIAYGLRAVPLLAEISPMILALALGAGLRAAMMGAAARPALTPGLVWCQKRGLRIAVALLGAQLTVQQLAALGWRGGTAVAAALVISFVAVRLLGRALGVAPSLATLIAAGTAVCGGSAVAAVQGVAGASEDEAAYAAVCVSLFGALSLALFPALAAGLELDARHYGLWVGASVQEVAQVTAAAFQQGPIAGEAGLVAKLARVALLAPLVLALSWGGRRAGGSVGLPAAPWFLLGFVALAGLNSAGLIPAAARAGLGGAAQLGLTCALAAMGWAMDLGRLRARGLRPLLLAAAGWIIVSGVGLALIWSL